MPASRLWFALAEIIFYFGCMAAYILVRRAPRRIPLVAGLLALLAATDLMYHFPPLFTILTVLDRRADLAGQTLSSSLYRSLMLDPQVLAMSAHVWLAAIAVTGIMTMRMAARVRPGDEPAAAAEHVKLAARWALAASLAQLPVGIWLLLTVPGRSREALMGGDVAGSLLFVLAIVGTFGLLHHLGAAAFGDTAPGQICRAVALVFGVVLLMTAALDRTREPSAEPAGAVTFRLESPGGRARPARQTHAPKSYLGSVSLEESP